MKSRRRRSYESKQVGTAKGVCVRIDPESYAVFKEMAELNGWGIGGAVRYCAEHYLGIEPPKIVVTLPEGIEPHAAQKSER